MPAFDSAQAQSSVFDALIGAARKYGMRKPILEDQERNPLTYLDLIRAAFALGGKIAGFTKRGERVGVMLPSSVGGVVTFFAMHAFGRIPTMLNFTAGIRNLKAACELAGVWAWALVPGVAGVAAVADAAALDALVDVQAASAITTPKPTDLL